MGGEWSLGVALVMESWPARTRPVLAGLIGAAGNLGYVLVGCLGEGMLLSGVQVGGNGWRWLLMACALPALFTFLLRTFVPESEEWKHATASGPRVGLVDIFGPALWRRTLLATVLAGVPLLGTWGSVQWVPFWLDSISGKNEHLKNFAQIVVGLGAMLGSFYGSILAERVARRGAYIFLCVGSLIACAVLFRVFDGIAEVDVWFVGTLFTVGAFTAAFYGWLPLYLPELFPTRVRATGQGFGFNAGRMFAAGGVLANSYLLTEVFAGSFARAGASLSLIYLVGLVAIVFAPETRGKPLPD
jgi:MFS family permease